MTVPAGDAGGRRVSRSARRKGLIPGRAERGMGDGRLREALALDEVRSAGMGWAVARFAYMGRKGLGFRSDEANRQGEGKAVRSTPSALTEAWSRGEVPGTV